MGTYYQHLDMAERAQIQYLLGARLSVRAIAEHGQPRAWPQRLALSN